MAIFKLTEKRKRILNVLNRNKKLTANEVVNNIFKLDVKNQTPQDITYYMNLNKEVNTLYKYGYLEYMGDKHTGKGPTGYEKVWKKKSII